MPGVIETERGKVIIDEAVVAMIAGYAAIENYGLIDMTSRSATEAILKFIGGDSRKKGVKVTLSDPVTFDIDLYVKLMYGLSMNAVARNVMSNVRYRVEELTGFRVGRVNVHVEDVWVGQTD